MTLRSKQIGLSLVELMVSVAAGMIVVLGVTSVYISTITSSSDTLKQSRLNQELTTIMSVMSNDIRRAGVWAGTSPTDMTPYTTPQSNPFASAGNTALTIVDQVPNTTIDPFTAWPSPSDGDCILYAYDSALDGTLDTTDIFGFKLTNGVVQMRSAGAASGNNQCATGTWNNMSDGQAVVITSLRFDMAGSACINTTTDVAASKDCYAVAPTSGDITAQTRQIKITITGQAVNDSLITLTLIQTVRVRNDLVLATP